MDNVTYMLDEELGKQNFLKTKKHCKEMCKELTNRVAQNLAKGPTVSEVMEKEFKRQDNLEFQQKCNEFYDKLSKKCKSAMPKSNPVEKPKQTMIFNRELANYMSVKEDKTVQCPEFVRKNKSSKVDVSEKIMKMYGEENVKVIDALPSVPLPQEDFEASKDIVEEPKAKIIDSTFEENDKPALINKLKTKYHFNY